MEKQVFGSLLILFIASAGAASAQPPARGDSPDTGSVNRVVLLDPGLSLGRAVFLFPSFPGSELSFQGPSLTFPGGPFIGGFLEPRADLMSPLRLQMEKEKMSPFQMALGTIQIGAVGYMAYRHIKKYGLFR